MEEESSINGYWCTKAEASAWDDEPTSAVHSIRGILEVNNFSGSHKSPSRSSAIAHASIRLSLAHALFRVDRKAEQPIVGPAAVAALRHANSLSGRLVPEDPKEMDEFSRLHRRHGELRHLFDKYDALPRPQRGDTAFAQATSFAKLAQLDSASMIPPPYSRPDPRLWSPKSPISVPLGEGGIGELDADDPRRTPGNRKVSPRSLRPLSLMISRDMAATMEVRFQQLAESDAVNEGVGGLEPAAQIIDRAEIEVSQLIKVRVKGVPVFNGDQIIGMVSIVGSTLELGEWDPRKGLEMEIVQEGEGASEWEISVPQVRTDSDVEFKFLAEYSCDTIVWEAGWNRHAGSTWSTPAATLEDDGSAGAGWETTWR
ncbi:hypothetical protein RQP46_007530 [Phenoliferia psychrophenolica]